MHHQSVRTQTGLMLHVQCAARHSHAAVHMLHAFLMHVKEAVVNVPVLHAILMHVKEAVVDVP